VKKYLLLIMIIAVALISSGLYLATRKPNKQPLTNNSQVNTQTIIDKMKLDNGQLIDVRTTEEYATSHAQNAVNVPIATIQNGDLSKIDKNRPVYLYCRTGHRAGLVKAILEQAGYNNVTNIGGLTDWQKQGGLVVVS